MEGLFAPRWLLLILSLAFIVESAGATTPFIAGSATPTMEVATMPLNDYLRAVLTWELAHGNHTASTKINLKIPSLDIYGPEGQLVFHGEDPVKNAELLHRLPAGLNDLKPVSPQQNLSRALDIVADFQKKSSQIGAAKKYTIYATTATTCK